MSGYRTRRWISFVIIGLIVAACDSANMRASDSAVAGYVASAPLREVPPTSLTRVEGRRGNADEKAEDKARAAETRSSASAQQRVGSMIIRNGDVAIQVDSV